MTNRVFSPEDDSVARIHDQLAHLAKIKSGTPFAVPAARRLTLSIGHFYFAHLGHSHIAPTQQTDPLDLLFHLH